MTLTWRTPGPDDADALGQMHRRAWVDTYRAHLPRDYFEKWTAADSVRRWQGILAEPLPPGVTRWAVFDAEDVVGWAVSGPSRPVPGSEIARPLELWGVYVRRDHLGSGLGQQLLDACLADAPAQLWVFRGNHRALAFYRRNGFAPDGRTNVDPRFPALPEIRLVR